MDGWKMILSFCGKKPIFRGLLLFVSGRVFLIFTLRLRDIMIHLCQSPMATNQDFGLQAMPSGFCGVHGAFYFVVVAGITVTWHTEIPSKMLLIRCFVKEKREKCRAHLFFLYCLCISLPEMNRHLVLRAISEKRVRIICRTHHQNLPMFLAESSCFAWLSSVFFYSEPTWRKPKLIRQNVIFSGTCWEKQEASYGFLGKLFCIKCIAGWWFQIFFIFIPTWGNDLIWL